MPADLSTSRTALYIILPLFIASVWVLALTFASVLSGWFTLANHFRSALEPSGETRSASGLFSTVYFRYWTHYSGIIRFTSAADGLYLSVFFLFRPGHPPLRIPWSEISFSRTQWFFRSYVVLILGTAEQIPLRIPQRMAERLGILNGPPPFASPLSGLPVPPPLQ